ncbi:hypothetical protein [Cystobacter fuscus]|uniref:hypothetical protein n=1 Tax=Cystobacter fuscus TaxID=43 RepID=UPI002FC5DC72
MDKAYTDESPGAFVSGVGSGESSTPLSPRNSQSPDWSCPRVRSVPNTSRPSGARNSPSPWMLMLEATTNRSTGRAMSASINTAVPRLFTEV